MAPRAKLYLVVRGDLPPGLQASQLVHAGQEWALAHEAKARAWRDASNTVALLAVPDAGALVALKAAAFERGVATTEFYDPDLDPPLTALVLDPVADAVRVCRGLRPALRPA